MPYLNRLHMALTLSLLWQGAACAAAVPITSVVLYPGSATIERTATVAPGTTRLEVDDLPANFDMQTLRVQADGGIQIGQIVSKDTGRTQSVGTRQAQIESAIEALQDKLAVLDVDAKSAALVQKYLENLSGTSAAATDKPQPYIDAKSMAQVLEAIRRGGNDAFDRIHKTDVQKREINKQIEALQRDLAKLHSGAKDTRAITINLHARSGGSVRLSYQVNGAGWKPTYRALLNSTASTVELERLATVSQKTGEDWSNVKLKLSTGQPRLSPQAPEPQPWLLSYRKPMPAQRERWGAAPAMAPLAPSSVQVGGMARKESADPYLPPVIETEGTFATEFEVPARVDLPADGREIAVALARQSVPVKQRVRIAPRLEKAATVTAEAPRPAGVWLPGAIQLFRDGSYVGATDWHTQASDRFVFPFGRDDLIRVAVDRTDEQSGTAGLLGQNNERHIAEVYTITSFHKSPVDLLVLESSPVSVSEEVKVRATFTPQPSIEAWEKRRGVVGWETVIQPNQSVKYSVDYRVSYPKEGTVGGLP